MSASGVLMVRPKGFSFNCETAASNKFQKSDSQSSGNGTADDIAQIALSEFDNAVQSLRSHGISVTVAEDSADPIKPDAVFPNNWVTFHLGLPKPLVVLYPMCAPNRRTERRSDIVDMVVATAQTQAQTLGQVPQHAHRVVDLSPFEAGENGQYLEGTGSMVIDHMNGIVYAAVSARMEPTVLRRLATLLGYRAVAFEAVDESGYPIYHTNVLMSIANEFVVVCAESIVEQPQDDVVKAVELANGLATPLRTDLQAVDATVVDYCNGHVTLVPVELMGHSQVLQLLRQGTDKTTKLATSKQRHVIEITRRQMGHFAGNMLEVMGKRTEAEGGGSKPVLVLSTTAHSVLTEEQLSMLGRMSTLLPVPIPTIERYGGGSIRCMLCELR